MAWIEHKYSTFLPSAHRLKGRVTEKALSSCVVIAGMQLFASNEEKTQQELYSWKDR
jgi:hypothetical protein